MSLKLKALGLGLLATLAMSAVVVVNAGANSSGHFTASAHHVVVSGKEDATHKTEFTVPDLPGLVCDEVSYSATINEADTTAESISVEPSYKKCKTTGGAAGEIEVDMNGCYFTFKVGKKATTTAGNTVDIVCPGATKHIIITHEPCDVTIPPQTGLTGIGYHTHLTSGGKHALTISVDVPNVTSHIEGPFFPCGFVATNRLSTMEGSVTVTGSSGGNVVDITATGSED